MPVTILIQFTKVVNLFFLINSFLQATPSISNNSPLATAIPLAFVVILGVIKELIAEIKRWQEDREFNGTVTKQVIFEGGKIALVEKRLDQVHVGDILEIVDDEIIPADCIILHCDDLKGKAYIQTAQLDGERMLKPKFAPIKVQENFTAIFSKHLDPSFKFEARTVEPSKDLYYFFGHLDWNKKDED